LAGLLTRLVIAAAAAAAALGCVTSAIAFMVGALYLFLLAVPMQPETAKLLVGLTLLGIAVGMALVAERVAGGAYRRRRRRAGNRSAGASLVAQLGDRVASEAATAVEAHPGSAMVLVFIIGLALGGSPEMQQIIKAALRARGA
jgi:hypothetical protein